LVEPLKELDRRLASIIERIGPCHLERGCQGITALVDSIVGQQLSGHAAGAIRSRLYSLLRDGDIDPAHYRHQRRRNAQQQDVVG
jgi:3-methyladenine DNA glycosylase/8-oxoguanine DNA glycosylase